MTVMVVNEGEIDLYLNFACSCRLHDISMKNVIVFAGSRCDLEQRQLSCTVMRCA